MDNQWQLQEAKSKFSHIVDRANEHGPQFLTRHGHKAAVVISFEDYQKMSAPEESLSDFLKMPPFADSDFDVFDRAKEVSRDIDL
ncbi:type II toxin-antitoxin system Phd/YefM family antitoxin [Endozoicomonas arenosclerae]|uniref:type II toxin-antitoxin system Phd/YefM family antitoxin n=1 Tax=Endozoicomonas arenosclerae TaxID=1633495 RepID=UPI0007853413|nr:type II toxin-antitoxin system Phd/YefM family antitoxin [Endozoicomonas arenosclerae]